MINKKNLLGKPPLDLGDKDAIHVAIVAVRAGRPINPGQRCTMNEFGEAVPGDGPGVADPFRSTIAKGESFWLLLNQDAVPNVRHVWEHPSFSFAPPKSEPEKNDVLVDIAEELGVTYRQLIDACAKVVESEEPLPYPGTLSREDFESAIDEVSHYELWGEWADESGYEFPNYGTECCPEREYPRTKLFEFNDIPKTALEARDRS